MRITIEWEELRARCLSGTIAAFLAAVLFWMSKYPIGSFLCRLVIRAIAWMATYELMRMTHIVYRDLIHPSFQLALSVIFFVSLDFFSSILLSMMFALSLLSTLIFFDPFSAFIRLSIGFFSFLYIHLPVALFEEMIFEKVKDGRWWVLYLLLITKGSDIGAYFLGKHFGKKPLAPILSPNKTIIGLVGGIGTGVIIAFILCLIDKPSSWHFLTIVGLSPFVALLSQFGDLVESSFKRSCGVTGSGSIPGIGGVLDALDSILMTCPLIYALACL